MGVVSNDNNGTYVLKKAIWAAEPHIFALKEKSADLGKEIKTKRRIFFTGVGIGYADYLPSGDLTFGKANVERINAALKKYTENQNGNVDYLPGLFWGAVSRRDMYLHGFREAGENDICIIYYSGICLANPVLEKGFIDLLFSNDRVEAGNLLEGDNESFGSHLQRVTEGLSTNIVLILDFARSVFLPDDTREVVFPSLGDNRLLCIQNCSPHKVRPAVAEEASFDDNNIFSETLIGLLEGEGFHYSYKEFFERIVLRMSQSEETRRPKLTAIPESILQYRLFSPTIKNSSAYKIYFDGSDSKWKLNAGANQGLRNSLPFMSTVFGLPDGSEVTVEQVEADHSVVSFPPYYTSGEYTASLIQQSFSKIKVAIAETVPVEQKQQLLEIFHIAEIHLIELTKEVQQARFLIHYIEGGFALTWPTYETEHFSIRSIFRPQPDPHLFIEEMEAIAKWQGVLELENPVSKFSDQSIDVIFEIVEGYPYDHSIDQQPAIDQATNPDRVILHYIRPAQVWVSPSFRCRIKVNSEYRIQNTGAGGEAETVEEAVMQNYPASKNFLNESPAANSEDDPALNADWELADRMHTETLQSAPYPGRRGSPVSAKPQLKLHIAQLYLGNQFSIGGGDFSLARKEGTDYFDLRYQPAGQTVQRNTIPVSVSNYQISHNIFETYNYLKIFISEEPIDLKPLWQLPLKNGSEPGTKKESVAPEVESIRFPKGGWHSVTIPIKITYGQKEDIYR
ncbi:hypothetical protein [Pollutibacter soli]|uniref:hypothetical protein n=1 Tax=Pollutibacter soli TaxID=3034157 RepID=UPI003013FB0B